MGSTIPSIYGLISAVRSQTWSTLQRAQARLNIQAAGLDVSNTFTQNQIINGSLRVGAGGGSNPPVMLGGGIQGWSTELFTRVDQQAELHGYWGLVLSSSVGGTVRTRSNSGLVVQNYAGTANAPVEASQITLPQGNTGIRMTDTILGAIGGLRTGHNWWQLESNTSSSFVRVSGPESGVQPIRLVSAGGASVHTADGFGTPGPFLAGTITASSGLNLGGAYTIQNSVDRIWFKHSSGNAFGMFLTTGGVQIEGDMYYGISPSQFSNHPDTRFYRVSAGVWGMGTTANNALGSLNLANITASATIGANNLAASNNLSTNDFFLSRFMYLQGGSGPRISNSGNTIQLRNNVNSADADLALGTITASGNIIQSGLTLSSTSALTRFQNTSSGYRYDFDFNTPGQGGRINIGTIGGNDWLTVSGRPDQANISFRWGLSVSPFIGVGSQDGFSRTGFFYHTNVGVELVSNNGANDPILRWGGTSASPALKRSGTTLQVRLADDSGFAPIQASNFIASATVTGINALQLTNSSLSIGFGHFFRDTDGQVYLRGETASSNFMAPRGDLNLEGGDVGGHLGTFVNGGNVRVRGGNAASTTGSAGNGGNVFVFGGNRINTGSEGDVILAHTGSTARGRVLIGTATDDNVNLLQVAGSVTTSGFILVNGAAAAGSTSRINGTTDFLNGTAIVTRISAAYGVHVGNSPINFGSSPVALPDAQIIRSSAEVVDINNGTAGQFADLRLRSITATGNVQLGASATTLGFYGTTAIARPTTAFGSATVVSPGGGNTIKTDDTFDGYTLAQVVRAIRSLGLLT